MSSGDTLDVLDGVALQEVPRNRDITGEQILGIRDWVGQQRAALNTTNNGSSDIFSVPGGQEYLDAMTVLGPLITKNGGTEISEAKMQEIVQYLLEARKSDPVKYEQLAAALRHFGVLRREKNIQLNEMTALRNITAHARHTNRESLYGEFRDMMSQFKYLIVGCLGLSLGYTVGVVGGIKAGRHMERVYRARASGAVIQQNEQNEINGSEHGDDLPAEDGSPETKTN